jgi:hypothetical protein
MLENNFLVLASPLSAVTIKIYKIKDVKKEIGVARPKWNVVST